MNYWPVSQMLNNEKLSPEQRLELQHIGRVGISESTVAACLALAFATPPCTAMTVMCSEGAQWRRVYLRRPTEKEWDATERSGFVQFFGYFVFIMDGLH